MNGPWSLAMFPGRADVQHVVKGAPHETGTRGRVVTTVATAVPCSIQEFAPLDAMNALGAVGSKESAIAYFRAGDLPYVPQPDDQVRDHATGRVYLVTRTIDEAGRGQLLAVHLTNVVA